MVVYVVYRHEVGLGPEWVRRWHSTEALAHVYARHPDPLQRALLTTFHRLPGDYRSLLPRGGQVAVARARSRSSSSSQVL